MNVSDLLLHRLWRVTQSDITEDIEHLVKRCIIDYLGVVFAGSYISKGRSTSFIGEGDTPVFGTDVKTNLLYAGMLNGFNAHILELDDGHRYGMVHVGAVIISAVFSVATHEKIFDSSRILKSILCGYETTIALARIVQPEHKLNGFHASGTCGTVGAAMAVGVLLNHDKNDLKRTLSLASTSAAGLLVMIDGDSELKPYNIGRAAMDGIAAAYMGKNKWNYPDDPLGSGRGFIDVLSCGGNDLDLWNGDVYYISEIYTKPYASCRHCHSAVEASIKIRNNLHDFSNIKFGNIEKIVIKTYKLAIRGHDHKVVKGEQSAKMSIPYSVAVALLYGESGYEAFSEERIADPMVSELMRKTMVEEYEPYSAMCPGKRIANVQIEYVNGKVLHEVIEYPLGEPENPMSDRQIESKSLSLMKLAGLTDDLAKSIIDSVWQIERNMPLNIWNLI